MTISPNDDRALETIQFGAIEDALADRMAIFEDGDNAGYPIWSWLDDPAGMSEYKEETSHWCCGIAEWEADIKGRRAIIGINYGH